MYQKRLVFCLHRARPLPHIESSVDSHLTIPVTSILPYWRMHLPRPPELGPLLTPHVLFELGYWFLILLLRSQVILWGSRASPTPCHTQRDIESLLLYSFQIIAFLFFSYTHPVHGKMSNKARACESCTLNRSSLAASGKQLVLGARFETMSLETHFHSPRLYLLIYDTRLIVPIAQGSCENQMSIYFFKKCLLSSRTCKGIVINPCRF